MLHTINEQFTADYRIKGSKFLGYLFPCEDETAWNEKLAGIKKEHPTATHHCQAYRIGPNNITEFSSDDGEPSGTAGLPMLNKLRSEDVLNVGLVVVRYYGGTKLGKSGLIDAYGHTAERCLQNANLLRIMPTVRYEIIYPYDKEGAIEQLFKTFGLREEEATYLSHVTKVVACPAEHSIQFERELERISHFGIYSEPLGRNFIAES